MALTTPAFHICPNIPAGGPWPERFCVLHANARDKDLARHALNLKTARTRSADVRPTAPVAAQVGVKHMVPPAPVDLQIALRDTFILEAAFFQHPA